LKKVLDGDTTPVKKLDLIISLFQLDGAQALLSLSKDGGVM